MRSVSPSIGSRASTVLGGVLKSRMVIRSGVLGDAILSPTDPIVAGMILILTSLAIQRPPSWSWLYPDGQGSYPSSCLTSAIVFPCQWRLKLWGENRLTPG